MITLNLRGSQPIYEQIVTQYKYLVLQGYLKQGDAIPSVRKLAMELEVTPGTVAKAYRELERAHVIETIRGKGTFIAGEGQARADQEIINKIKAEMKEKCMELLYQGMEKKEIIHLVEEILDSLTKGERKTTP